ncbi:hypothetical protein [Alteromonas gilva]|uniref:Uncharacterized protein n=1 Tax=Alteromonas gilva TaxID=2987522 RepID=A0ABT5L9Q2_9ALTE|nr:hypothetical protein [Alteromonas gilva]MDC8832867.1 hypothetical protein [Alteromonas gilva]
MLNLLLALVLMPVVILAALGSDVTLSALFAGEAVVIAMYFILRKKYKNKPYRTSYRNTGTSKDEECGLDEETTYHMRKHSSMFDDRFL